MTNQSELAQGHPARRREIVDAARQLAADQGWAAVTVRAVASRVGCSAPALYQYFRDKDAILAALAAEGRQLLAQDMDRAIQSVNGPAKRLRAALRALWDFAHTNPELYAVMFGLVGGENHAGGFGPALASLRHAAADLAVKREVPEQADDLTDSLAAMAHGFIAQTLSGSFPGGAERAQTLFLALVEEIAKSVGKH